MSLRRAYTLLESIVILAAIAVIACVLAPVMAQTQSAQRLSSCSGLLRQLGLGMHSYTNEYAGRLPTFSWRSGATPAMPGSPVYGWGAPTDTYAVHYQARDIIWRRTGGFDIGDQQSWVADLSYNHLVLIDYLGWNPITRPLFCNEDRHRFNWLAARQQFRFGTYTTYPVPEPVLGRWSFSSSFLYVPPSWSPNGGPNAVYQGTTHQSWVVPSSFRTTRRIDEVSYPAQKVFLYDSIARHMPERWYFYAWTQSRQPLLFFDLSVREKSTGNGNRGFNPSTPTSNTYTVLRYEPPLNPNNWEAPTLTGQQSDLHQGAYFRFTRSGLRGRDFDGPEVPW